MNYYDSDCKDFDPTGWLQGLSPAVPAMSFKNLASRDSDAVASWQAAIRERFTETLGGFPEERCPLNAIVLDSQLIDGEYRREAVTFQTREGLTAFAFVLVPAKGDGPFPLMAAFHGHGYGVNAVIGLDERGKPLAALDYHNAFAVQAVKRGYVVVALEILGFGRRRINNNCQVLSGAALMLGETMAGWRAYDGMRAIDYALTRPDVDPNRVAAMGISGGGLNTLFLAALDERVKGAVVSGFLNEFTACVMSLDHCIDNFSHGTRVDMEMSDIAGAVAPRALWCENGTNDPIFPIAAFHRAIADTRAVYDALGAGDRLHGHEFNDGHRFDGAGCWEFLERQLGGY